MAVCAYRILNCWKLLSQDGIVDGSKELLLKALHMNEIGLLWLWTDLYPHMPKPQSNKEQVVSNLRSKS